MTPARRVPSLLAALALAFGCGLAQADPQYTVQTLQPATDGSTPAGRLLAGSDGALYGTAENGGAHGAGTIYRVDAKGRVTVLHAFDGTDGYSIIAGLTAGSDGWFYGASALGAANGLGGLFKIDRAGKFVPLHAFADGPDHGANEVFSPLTLGPDGNFYGTTVLSSGYPVHNGTVFKMTPAGAVTILYVFGVRAVNPYAGVTFGPDGLLYGTTNSDGHAQCGVLYSLATDGTGFKLVHQFDALQEGCQPISTLVAGADGALYGTTQFGGADGGQGTIYRFDTRTAALSVLHTFHDNDPIGAWPKPGLARDAAGTFYGATLAGATNGQGGIFSLSADGGTLTLLHGFADDGVDGANPLAAPTVSGTTLAGTTLAGGTTGQGTVYRLLDLGQ